MEDALGGASTPVSWVVAVGLWLGWAIVLLALLVPRTVSLTVLRVGAPGLAVVSLIAAGRGGVDDLDLLAVTVAAVVLVVAAWPTVGADLVDGSSYGPEKRLPLRVPPSLALGPAPLAVAVVLLGVSVGPLFLAGEQWVLGVLVTLVGAGLAVLAARSLHALSRRFLVFVPGGVVVHDPLTREESCGAHYRTEYQEGGECKRNDELFAHVAAWEWKGAGEPWVRHTEKLEFASVKLSRRSYG